jgi:hypothetical protein
MARKEGERRDTSVDPPRAVGVGEIIEAPRLGLDVAAIGAEALVRARSVETLEALYGAWSELHAAWKTARRRWTEEQQRLEEQGSLLLGAMKAAAGTGAASSSALATTEGLAQASAEAEAKLRAVREDFAHQIARAEQGYALEVERLRSALLERVRRHAAVSRPDFRVAVRVVGERRILHAKRLSDDDAVLALFALTGRAPSRYGFLADDSTDDVRAAPPSLYPDEGLTEVRPPPAALLASLKERTELWPVKGCLPLLHGERLVRWVSRGAVLEAELAEGGGWRNLLTRDEAEQLTGLLLALKLAGKIDFELVRD